MTLFSTTGVRGLSLLLRLTLAMARTTNRLACVALAEDGVVAIEWLGLRHCDEELTAVGVWS